MAFGRLFCAENILLNDSSVKNRVIVQEYGVSFNSIGIVQEFIYISLHYLLVDKPYIKLVFLVTLSKSSLFFVF